MLVGRRAETETIDRLLADARNGTSGVLVLRGEPGIGKTALLDRARKQAEGMLVLRCMGVESESELPFAGLHQLLHPVLDRINALDDPQAAALRAALGISSDPLEDRFRVAVALLALLGEVADERPLLCVVDDAQWVDAVSIETLLFAARRVQAEPLAILFAARDDALRPFLAPGLPELRLEALGVEDARRLAVESLRAGREPDAVEWLVESAHGNPLVLIELAVAWNPSPGAAAPVTSVEEQYLDRIRLLPSAVRRLLVVAAAEDTGDRGTIVRAAAELEVGLDALETAEAAGLIDVTPQSVTFRHPLVRSAAYRGSTFAERERAHGAIATVLVGENDGDRRAWHRAAAAAEPDEDVAAELERTAERARARGGHAAASLALQRAAELTPADATRARRLVLAVTAAHLAGDAARAIALAERATPLVSDPRMLADLALVQGESELLQRLPARASDLFASTAEAIAGAEAAKALELAVASITAAATCGDPARVARAHRIGRDLDIDLADERQAFLRLALDGTFLVYHPPTDASAVPVLDLLSVRDSLSLREKMQFAATAIVLGDWHAASVLYAEGIEASRAAGALFLPHALAMHAVIDVLAGRVAEAAARADEAVRLARALGTEHLTPRPLAALAAVAAVQGRDEDCHRLVDEVLEQAQPRALALPAAVAAWAPAMLALGRGRWDEALDRFSALREIRLGFGHPQVAVLAVPNLVEAAARAGRPELADEPLATFAAWAEQTGTPFAQARLERCRALLADTLEAAAASYEAALDLHPSDDGSFERARTHLLYGEALRRLRRRSDAREQLRSALHVFEQVRAAPWAERAAAELRATGETARRRDASTVDQLTPQELQISRLVAEGASNKEVAAQLFLSPRTVEYHLRKVFMKLGIASRAELIRQGVGMEPATV